MSNSASASDFVPPTYPGDERLLNLPTQPLRIIVSACLTGAQVVDDGSARLRHPLIVELLSWPNVESIAFCPEHASFGTPRSTPNCVGGNGYDVLDGKASFMSHDGDDWTTGILRSATEMARQATEFGAHLAILLHISGACGTSVIYDGHRDLKKYQRGPGVAAAALIRAGVPVISQVDYRALRIVMKRVNPDWIAPEGMPERNMWEDAWYQENIGPLPL